MTAMTKSTVSLAALRKPNKLRTEAPVARGSAPDDEGLFEAGAHAAPRERVIGRKNGTAYALFTKTLLSGLIAYTIDTSSGKVLAHHGVKGPFADYMELYYGEGTRLLPWDPSSAKFFLADSDLSGGVGNGCECQRIPTRNPHPSPTAVRNQGCSLLTLARSNCVPGSLAD